MTTDESELPELGSAGSRPGPEPAEATGPGPADWAIVGGLCVLAFGCAVVAFFFLPFRLGSFPFPVSALIAVAATGLLPRPCHRLTGSMVAAVAPVAVWFLTTLLLFALPSGLYRGYPIRILLDQWRMLVLIGLGCLGGAASIGLVWGDHLRAAAARNRAG